jgi:hypothetical protein
MIRYIWLAAFLAMVPSLACTQGATELPSSFLEGTLTVNAAIDSTGDFSGIEVIVTDGTEAGADTLGYAVTNAQGYFSTDIVASEKGIFPLIIKRGSAVLSVSQFVVAEDDSATIRAELPLGQRIPIVKSYENSAWIAFTNAEQSHNERVSEMLTAGTLLADEIRKTIELESEILWSIRDSYPGSMAADVAAAKSIVMLDGWNDSLLVERTRLVDPGASGFAEAVAAAGRAESRLHGVDAGLSFLYDMREAAEKPEDKAEIQLQIVQAYLDTENGPAAVAEAETLKVRHPQSPWAEWATRAQYEARNLLPGMPAPPFSLSAIDGGVVSLDSLLGKLVVIDFWSPRDPQAAQQLPEIARVVESDGWSQGLAWVSVPLEPDQDLLDAFFEGREVPGVHLRDTDEKMQDLITRYNVQIVPTRYLVGKDGLLIEKFPGNTLLQLSAKIENMSAG